MRSILVIAFFLLSFTGKTQQLLQQVLEGKVLIVDVSSRTDAHKDSILAHSFEIFMEGEKYFTEYKEIGFSKTSELTLEDLTMLCSSLEELIKTGKKHSEEIGKIYDDVYIQIGMKRYKFFTSLFSDSELISKFNLKTIN